MANSLPEMHPTKNAFSTLGPLWPSNGERVDINEIQSFTAFLQRPAKVK